MLQSHAVTSLFKERILLPPETVSNSLLGCLFLREKLLETVLGDCEVHILYWVGKELGNSLDVNIVEEIGDIFMQLDLGQVQLESQQSSIFCFKVAHHRFNLVPVARLEKTLHLETGFIAGILEKITGKYCAAELTVHHKDVVFATIEVAVEE